MQGTSEGQGIRHRACGRLFPQVWRGGRADVLMPLRSCRAPKTATALAAVLSALLSTVALAHPHGRVECRIQLKFEAGRPVAAEQRLRFDEPTSALLVERLQLSVDAPASSAMQGRTLMVGLFRRAGWFLDLRPHDVVDAAPVAVEHDSPARWSLDDYGRVVVVFELRLAPVAEGKRWKMGCVDPEWYSQGEFDSVTPVRVEGAACSWQRRQTDGLAAAPAMIVPSFARSPTASAERPTGELVPASGILECGG